MTTNTYGGYTVDQLREFIRHHYDAEHGGDNIDELTNDSSASVKIVRDLLDAVEPQQDGDLLRPIARWVYNAVRVNLDLLHGICSEFGCPQGEDVATWLRAQLAGVPAPCMCSGPGPCEKRTDDSCRRDRAAALAPAAEPVPRKTAYVLVPVEPTQAMLDRGYWPCTQGRGAKSVWGEMLRAIPAAPQPPAPAAAREGLTESDVFTLIGHAGLLRGCGETDMPAWCLGLAHRIAVGIDASLALRVEALKEQDAAHPAQPEPRASAAVIAAALAVIEADRAQTLTTEHIDALDNAIKIQRGELTLPEPRAEVSPDDQRDGTRWRTLMKNGEPEVFVERTQRRAIQRTSAGAFSSPNLTGADRFDTPSEIWVKRYVMFAWWARENEHRKFIEAVDAISAGEIQ
ncbi:hypothetical protein [Burkholderia vietnamiensis]